VIIITGGTTIYRKTNVDLKTKIFISIEKEDFVDDRMHQDGLVIIINRSKCLSQLKMIESFAARKKKTGDV
jgi:hypothetical protein